MASRETWDKLKYFRPDGNVDKWGDPDVISDDLLFRLDDFRGWIGFPIYILRGVATSGHTDGSYHYPKKGACAVDLVVPNFQGSPYDLILNATRFGFTGIGYYPNWRWNGNTVGGLHLDVRPLKWDADGTINYSHSRWIGRLIDGKMSYEAMTYDKLKQITGE